MVWMGQAMGDGCSSPGVLLILRTHRTRCHIDLDVFVHAGLPQAMAQELGFGHPWMGCKRGSVTPRKGLSSDGGWHV